MLRERLVDGFPLEELGGTGRRVRIAECAFWGPST
jgi:hypothetical protein